MRIVIPSVGYADFLADVLPAWRALAPAGDLRVVTEPSDPASAEIASQHGATVIVTDVWRADGAVLNKGGALDAGFTWTTDPPATGEVCIAADADVVPVGQPPTVSALDMEAVYGCARFDCPKPAMFDAWRAGKLALERLPLILPRVRGEQAVQLAYRPTPAQIARAARRVLGYCQVFRARPGLTFGPSKTAGGYDRRFVQQFARREALRSLYVVHLGDQDRRNWHGRIVAPWRGAA